MTADLPSAQSGKLIIFPLIKVIFHDRMKILSNGMAEHIISFNFCSTLNFLMLTVHADVPRKIYDKKIISSAYNHGNRTGGVISLTISPGHKLGFASHRQ